MQNIIEFINERLKLNSNSKINSRNTKTDKLIEDIAWHFNVDTNEYWKWITNWVKNNDIKDVVYVMTADDYELAAEELGDDPNVVYGFTFVKDDILVNTLSKYISNSNKVNIDEYDKNWETDFMIVHQAYQCGTTYCVNEKKLMSRKL